MKGVSSRSASSSPRGHRCACDGAGLPFNAVDRGVSGIEGRPGYDVQVEGIFSAVEVRTDRAISPDPPPLPASPPPVAPSGRPPAEAPAPPSPPGRPRPEAGPPASQPIG